MSFLTSHNQGDNFMDVLMHSPQRYLPIVEFTDRVTQDLSQLSWADCEYIATEISKVNGSGFCTGIHSGISNALHQQAKAPRSANIHALLVFAKKLNQNSATVDKKDIESVRQAGWSEQSIEDIVGLVAIINSYNILANGLGYRGLSDEAFKEMGDVTVQHRGYVPTFRVFVEQTASAESTG